MSAYIDSLGYSCYYKYPMLDREAIIYSAIAAVVISLISALINWLWQRTIGRMEGDSFFAGLTIFIVAAAFIIASIIIIVKICVYHKEKRNIKKKLQMIAQELIKSLPLKKVCCLNCLK